MAGKNKKGKKNPPPRVSGPAPTPPREPKLGPLDPEPRLGEIIVDEAGSYLGDWWHRHKAIVKAFVDDVLLYTVFLGFVRLMKYLFHVSDSGGDLERHHQLHDWGFLVCDAVILFGFIRKLIVLMAHH